MIFVTGGTGRIGNVLVNELVKSKEKVRVLVRDKKKLGHLSKLKDKVEFFEADLTNSELINKACKGVRLVYHLGAIVSIIAKDKDLMYNVNVNGTNNIINACVKNNVKKLVFMSTIHAIKEPETGVISEELGFDVENAISYYDITKAIASVKVLQAVKNKKLKAVIVCPTGVLGPYDYNLSFITQYFINYLKGKQKFYISGAYDFVDVRDVVEGTIKASEKGKVGEVYLLSGNKISVNEINTVLDSFIKNKPKCIIIPYWLAFLAAKVWEFYCILFNKNTYFTPYAIKTLQRNSNISNNKARKELGYKPRLAQKSLEDQIKWFKKMKII